jgi:hypothetical protein
MAGWKISQSAADPTVTEWLTDAPWTFIGVMVAATIGAAVGSLAGYAIVAWGGRPLLDRYGRYVHINADDLDRADDWFARYGAWAVFFARFVPLLRALMLRRVWPHAAGIRDLRWRARFPESSPGHRLAAARTTGPVRPSRSRS